MLDLLFTIGGELGASICTKFENFVTLPHAPIQKENGIEEGNGEKEVLDWKELSMEMGGSIKSLTGRAEESYSAWLEWRKRVKVRKRVRDRKRVW